MKNAIKTRKAVTLLVIMVTTMILSSCATQHHKCSAYGSAYGDSHRKQGIVACRNW